MVESVASKTVLGPHPTAADIGIGNCVGVGVGVTTCVSVIATLLFADMLRESIWF